MDRIQSDPVELTVAQAAFDDIFSDMARVHLDHRPFSRAGQLIVIRHEWRRIVAVARGAHGNKRDTIWLDLRSREKLGLKGKGSAFFSFERAGLLDEFLWAWHATDAMPRIAARLAVVSVILGAVGLLLGGLSIWLTLCPPLK